MADNMGGVVEELKEVSYIAAPMVAVTVLQYQLQVVSVIIVGHLGQLALSGVALATSINNVTGFSLYTCKSPDSLLTLFYSLSSKRSLCTSSNKCYPICADDGLVKLGVSSGTPLCLFLSATCVLSYPFGLSSGGAPEPTRDDGYAGHLGLMVCLSPTRYLDLGALPEPSNGV
uniref:Uncharacterized protein n=1 Tax=Populus alba TaxID=43335 RepID=A0A4U5QBL1_POPAL|nr:hypothetical protein D5086_0000112270 [Populus alba]